MEKLPNADTIAEPLVFCTITGGDSGWFHVVVNTTAKTKEEAKGAAALMLNDVFAGKRKIVRNEPEAIESRDFERDCRIVSGFCRFSFCLTEGQVEHMQDAFDAGYKYVSFCQ